MNKKLMYLPIFLVLFFLSETANAKAGLHRRRKQNQCEKAVAQMAEIKVDCSAILRERYLDLIGSYQAGTCSRARHASYGEIDTIAKEVHFEKAVVKQCFGENLELATPEEKSVISQRQKQYLEESEAATIKGFAFMGIVGLLAVFAFLIL